MKRSFLILFISLSAKLLAQDTIVDVEKNFGFSGQMSGWMQFTPDLEDQKLWLGGRYIPQVDYKIPLKKNNQLIDFEASANIFGNLGFIDSTVTDGDIKPYRLWTRYSGSQFEFRVGLQKINFGSAQMFRPLMWFDRMDPRDPLQLTDGVWGGLFRYYFLNNANIWIWGLYGNNETKGWEVFPTEKNTPEFGGRVQLPIPYGEAALSYHHRKENVNINMPPLMYDENIAENRFGADIRMDVVVGLWAEASWSHLAKEVGIFTNQEMLTLGTDYTFGIGNGLLTTFEQFWMSNDEKAFAFDNSMSFSGLSLSYPIGMFDNISAMVYYDWTNDEPYFFLNWNRQLNNFMFYVMAYWNPMQIQLAEQAGLNNMFAGKGIQLMVVWNH